MYSTQKKRVAFNVSKMLSGIGTEGEVPETGHLGGSRAWPPGHADKYLCAFAHVRVHIYLCTWD